MSAYHHKIVIVRHRASVCLGVVKVGMGVSGCATEGDGQSGGKLVAVKWGA